MRSSLKSFLILLGVLIIIIPTLFGPHGVRGIVKMNRKIKDIKREISLLEKKRDKLKLEVSWLETHREALEPFAKEKLFVKRKGERVFVIIEREEQNQDR